MLLFLLSSLLSSHVVLCAGLCRKDLGLVLFQIVFVSGSPRASLGQGHPLPAPVVHAPVLGLLQKQVHCRERHKLIGWKG